MPLSGTEIAQLRRSYHAGELTPEQTAAFERRFPNLTGRVDPTSGMPLPETPEATEQAFRGAAERGAPVGRFLLPEVLGIGGSMAGTAVGGALGGAVAGPPGVPVGAFLGEAAGSYLGRRANVALGLEEPGMVGDIAAAAGGPVMTLGGKVLKGAARWIPGVGFGAMEEGKQRVQQVSKRLIGDLPSADLYQRVAQQNPMVQLNEVGKVAQEMLDAQMKLAPQARSAPIVNAAQGWLDMATQPQGIDFQTAWLGQKQLRQHIAGVGGLDEGARKTLDAAIMRDFEQIPGTIASELKRANKAYRTERAVDDLNEIINSAITEASQGTGLPRLNAGSMLKKFDAKVADKNDLFGESFSVAERGDIRDLLKDLARIPLPTYVAGQAYGSGLGILGGGTAFGLGGDPQMAAIGAAVMNGLPIALASPPGRAIVRGLIKSNRLWTPQAAAAMRGFLRTTGQEAAEEVMGQ
jgi:hypothetical protein